jgi:SAM-dependent methyltransferase
VSDRREATLRRLGLEPSAGDLVRAALGRALARAEAARMAQGAAPPAVVVLDAGCGRSSALARHRTRIGRFVGVDVHEPAPGALPYLDEFATVDLCENADAFPPATFDLVLSSFTVEHFADPDAAFANLARWLRPGGSLVLTTVNRRHPFVAAYLEMPDALRRRIQPLVKASAADAHPLVGACNQPAELRAALARAQFAEIRIEAVSHLARAWGRRRPTFVLGLVGDLLTRGIPSRRSTLVVTARIPELAA